jgi:hypothetical protein
MSGSGVGLDLVTATFGPRYTLPYAYRRCSFFGQILAGEAFGMHSTFPGSLAASSSASGLAMQMGGGVNYKLSSRWSARVLDAGWLRTQLPNSASGAQNELHLGAGIIYRLR